MNPIKKYNMGVRPDPVISAKIKETVEGHHGENTPIQVNPTNRRSLCLYFLYFEMMINPITVEIDTHIRLRVPLNISRGVNAIICVHIFSVFQNFLITKWFA